MEHAEKFHDWTVLEPVGKMRLSRCVCGTVRKVAFADIRAGKSKGCGCKARAALAERSRIANRVHGMCKSTEKRTWNDMIRRCHSPHRPDYANYGARGIYVCERWRNSFMAFVEDMGMKPEGHTLDRIDNDGPYSPDNCRWVPRKLQERNKRSNAVYDFNGERMTVAEAAERYGFKDNDSKRASEQFMQAYYRNAKGLTLLNTIVLQNMGAALAPVARPPRRHLRPPLVRHGRPPGPARRRPRLARP
jgi:hypothetical protein